MPCRDHMPSGVTHSFCRWKGKKSSIQGVLTEDFRGLWKMSAQQEQETFESLGVAVALWPVRLYFGFGSKLNSWFKKVEKESFTLLIVSKMRWSFEPRHVRTHFVYVKHLNLYSKTVQVKNFLTVKFFDGGKSCFFFWKVFWKQKVF